jgi:hypothetical protein
MKFITSGLVKANIVIVVITCTFELTMKSIMIVQVTIFIAIVFLN